MNNDIQIFNKNMQTVLCLLFSAELLTISINL